MMQDFWTYLSPFTWRYGSQEMRQIWSEMNKRRTWRQLWVVLAEVQMEYGLVSAEQVADLRLHADEVDMARALAIESEIHHDLMAELKTFAEQAALGGGILHLGATSMDIEDNADALRLRQALELLIGRLKNLLLLLAHKIESTADVPVMGFTHLQPAEPTTLGYRLSLFAQDLLLDWEALGRVQRGLKGKGFKGAVGTGASYAELLGGAEYLVEFETRLSTRLGLPFFMASTQVYPRKQDYFLISALAGLGGSLYKFAFDLRLLQSPMFGEWSEPFGKQQVGSSAMPFKRNPIQAEKIDSLARALAQMPRLAWDNAAHCLLERTLDDSANRRTMLPEAFLMADELLLTAVRILRGMVFHEAVAVRNFNVYGSFAAIERVLMALGKAGADRQVMHEKLRQIALQAWGEFQAGRPNTLVERVCTDPALQVYLPEAMLCALMDAAAYLGDAPQRALLVAQAVRTACAS